MGNGLVEEYIAGLFDGEGTVTLCHKNKNDKFRTPSVSIASTTLELLEFVKQNFNGCIIHKKHKKKEYYKEAYCWSVTNNRALYFLKCILPFLKEPKKVRRCNLLLEKYKLVTPRNGKYNNEKLIQKLQFEKEFFEL